MSSLYTEMSLEGPGGAQVDLMVPAYRRVTKADGFRNLNARTSSRAAVGRDGAINSTRYRDERLMIIEGLILDAVTNDSTVVWDEADEVAAAFAGATDTPRLLKWTAGGVALQAYVKLESWTAPAEVGPNLLSYQAQLHNPLGLALSQTLQTETVAGAAATGGGGLTFPADFPWTFLAISSTTVAVTNDGSLPAPVVLVLRGSMSNPKVICGDQRIVVEGDIAAGDELWIDTGARTVLLNNDPSADRRSMLRAAQSRWFYLPAKATTQLELQVDAFDGTAQLEVQFRDAR